MATQHQNNSVSRPVVDPSSALEEDDILEIEPEEDEAPTRLKTQDLSAAQIAAATRNLGLNRPSTSGDIYILTHRKLPREVDISADETVRIDVSPQLLAELELPDISLPPAPRTPSIAAMTMSEPPSAATPRATASPRAKIPVYYPVLTALLAVGLLGVALWNPSHAQSGEAAAAAALAANPQPEPVVPIVYQLPEINIYPGSPVAPEYAEGQPGAGREGYAHAANAPAPGEAKTDSAPSSAPEPPAAAPETPSSPSGPAFDRDGASAALSAAAQGASSCRNGESAGAMARVSVTFAPSGHVSSASVDGLEGDAAACVARIFRGIRVNPFGGPNITVHKAFRF